MHASQLLGYSTPLPIGVGIYVPREDGSEKPIPLIYVPQKAANARGKGVIAGWYAVAIPGSKFSVRITNVTEPGCDVQVHGRGVLYGRVIGAELWVDGVNALGNGRYKMSDAGREKAENGFVVGRDYPPGSVHGIKRVSHFRFSRAVASDEPVRGAGPDDGAGTVEIRLFEGDLRRGRSDGYAPPPTARWNSPLPAAPVIDEKAVSKAGCAVGVSRNGPQVHEESFMSDFYIDEHQRIQHGSVVVHLREPGWLIRNGILDSASRVIRRNPIIGSRPPPPPKGRGERRRVHDVIDLTGD